MRTRPIELCQCGHTSNYHWHYEGGCCYGPAYDEPRCECFMFETMLCAQ